MEILLSGALFILFYLVCMIVLVQYKGDTSIANFTWGGGVMLLAWFSLHVFQNFSSRQLLMTFLVTAWALRMIIHLYVRYTGRDKRFDALRQLQGGRALLVNTIYLLGPQALLLLVMAIPVVVVNMSDVGNVQLLDGAWLALWLVGFVCEACADYQLYAFMKQSSNSGKLMRFGLWRYSRHPNYFGEVVMWWAVFLLALPVPFGWLTVIAPATITVLLLFVTGVPLAEAVLKKNKDFDEYKRTTSVFIPWFNQRSS